MKFNAQCSFEKYVTVYQMTQYNSPGDLNLHGVETSLSEKKPELNLHVESLEGISLRVPIGTCCCVVCSVVKQSRVCVEFEVTRAECLLQQ